MGWLLLSLGIALGAVLSSYISAGGSTSSLLADLQNLGTRDFWHRSFLFQHASPFLWPDSKLPFQHAPPKDALSPHQQAKLANPNTTRPLEDPVVSNRFPVYFISHGIRDAASENVDVKETLPYKDLKALGKEIEALKPKAILIMGSGWSGEEQKGYVTSNTQNPLIYGESATSDYNESKFASAGDPDLAERVAELLSQPRRRYVTTDRGLDDTAWAPLLIALGEHTDIPIVQLSMLDVGSPKAFIKIGQAVASLREEGVLIIGSGMSVHNPNPKEIAKYRANGGTADYVEDFEELIHKAITDYTGSHREIKSQQITYHPTFRNAHPESDLILPLLFAIGAAGNDEAEVIFSMRAGSTAWGTYRFGQTDQVMSL